MSSETLSLIQQEVTAIREYLAQQEIRLQNIFASALCNASIDETASARLLTNIVESEKLKELQEALEKSKTAARAADGKIKLLQYQLAKSKAVPNCSTLSSSAIIINKVSFEEDKIQAASLDWLYHWMKMKPICQKIQLIQEVNETEQPNKDESKEKNVRNLELEISRCSDMGNMLDELGVLSESFVDTAQCENPVLYEIEAATVQETNLIQENSSPSIESDSIRETEDFIIPKAMCAKFFSPVSYGGSESVQSVTTMYEQDDICFSANSKACFAATNSCSVASKSLAASSSLVSFSCSLREYLEMKKRGSHSSQPTSPCSVTQLTTFFSTENSPNIATVEVAFPSSHCFPTKTIVLMDNIQMTDKCLISPHELKCIFQGFQAMSPSIVDTPEQKLIQQQTDDTISNLGNSRLTPAAFQYASQSHHSAIHNSVQKSSAKLEIQMRNTASSKKSVKSQASETKTISRLLDCGSSFISEKTDDSRDISCYTLNTEFDLLHNYQSSSYEMLRRRIVDVEQPLMSAKLVK